MTTETTRPMLFLLGGWLIWSSCLVLLYGGVYLGCEVVAVPGRDLPILTILLVVLWLAHLAAALWALERSWRSWRRRDTQAIPDNRFLPGVTLLLNGSALAGTVWIGLPTVVIPPCS